MAGSPVLPETSKARIDDVASAARFLFFCTFFAAERTTLGPRFCFTVPNLPIGWPARYWTTALTLIWCERMFASPGPSLPRRGGSGPFQNVRADDSRQRRPSALAQTRR